MCGICGYISKQQASPEQHQYELSGMLDMIYNRGPDDVGSYHKHPAHIGMRRLAIIDIQGGHQPLIDQSSEVSLVYNGELYNYRELKQSLIESDYPFHTKSDTEVLLQSFLKYRHDCWPQFNGMFAVALWEPRTQTLTLARDRFGQKPLYYIQLPGFFAFASDIRSLLAHPAIPFELEQDMIPRYLQQRHVAGPNTLIKHIKQVAPGHYLTLNSAHEISLDRYWSPEFNPDQEMTINEFENQFNAIWPNAIDRHLLSDVPVGGFLSGGIDSSLIAQQASKLKSDFKTLSIGFDDPAFDESQWAQQIATLCGSEHHVFQFTGTLSSMLKLWGKAYDQPFSDPASFPLLLLCQHARKQMTVALSGDGADELFAGYQRYKSLLLSSSIRKLPTPLRSAGNSVLKILARLLPAQHKARRYLDAVSRRLSLINGDIYQEYIKQFNLFDDDTLTNILVQENFKHSASLKPQYNAIIPNLLKHDLTHWLPDQMLVKTDRASMAVSLETRLPFLDNEIVDLALRTPHKLLIRNKQLKFALRSVASRTLPVSISQRAKHGFQVPVDQWLRDEADWVQDIIHSGLNRTQGLFKSAYIQNILQQHFTLKHNHGEPILTLLLFFVWQDNMRSIGD